MPMSPYILVLAQTSHEASRYVRRAKLPRGRWRIVARAGSIANIRQAEVHCLPGFHKRPDKHSIMAKLRYAKVDWKDVEMPPAPVRDLGDGMGEQLSLEDLEPVAYDSHGAPLYEHQLSGVVPGPVAAGTVIAIVGPSGRDLEVAYRYNALRDRDYIGEVVSEQEAKIVEANSHLEPVAESRVNKRRRRCDDCGELHFKDEPCARVDGVPEETPVVANPATMFD